MTATGHSRLIEGDDEYDSGMTKYYGDNRRQTHVDSIPNVLEQYRSPSRYQ